MTNRATKITIAIVVVIGICVLFVFGILAGAAVTGYRAATRAGNEAATVQNLKTIAAFEIQYFNTHDRTFGTLDQLQSEQLLSRKFSGNPIVADGYVITLSLARKPDGSSIWFKLTADPHDESTGRNHFYFDSDETRIRVNPKRQAGPTDPIADE
jgi:type II secretory pathway pseudopilin PulG